MHSLLPIFFSALHKEKHSILSWMLVLHQFVSKDIDEGKNRLCVWSQPCHCFRVAQGERTHSVQQQSITTQLARGKPHCPKTGKWLPIHLLVQVAEKC